MEIFCRDKFGERIQVGDKISYKSKRYGLQYATIIMLGQRMRYSWSLNKDILRDIIKVHTKKNSKNYYGYITNLSKISNIQKVK